MQDIETLKQMIKPFALVPCQGAETMPRVVLEEPQESDSSATISGLPSDILVIKADAFRTSGELFQGEMGECKRADYVMVSQKKRCIVYIELKRTKDNWNDIVKQLLGAQCFMFYCQEIGKAFWQQHDFLREYDHRFVSICHTSISKRTTRIERNHTNSSPEKAMRISWPKNIHFNSLIGKG